MNSFWKSLGQIAIAGIASYGAAKLSNTETSWNTYRNQMLQEAAATALTTALNQYAASTATPSTTQSTTTATTAQ